MITAAVLLCGCESLQQNSRTEPANAGQYTTTPQKIDFETITTSNFFKAIPWDKVKKSEFESQSGYIERLKSIIPGNSTFVEVDNSLTQHFFDAERNQLFFGMRMGMHSDYMPTRDCWLNVSRHFKVIGHHIAQNAYGAQWEVTDEQGELFQFYCLNLYQLPDRVRPLINDDPIKWDSIGFVIPMANDEAKAAIDSQNLFLILEVKPDQLELS